jgi:SAM-dependent methyltransferase
MTADDAAPSDRDAALLALGRALMERGHRFETVTPATQARVNARPGNARARHIRDVFGWSRPFAADLLPAGWLDWMRAAGVVEPAGGGWRATVRASTLGGRLFLHSAWPTTAADAVFFGPDTVRFVAAIERHLGERTRPVRRAVDIGCGAGPGAITVAAQRPDAEVTGLDINDAALRLGGLNARLAGVSNVAFRRSDLLSDIAGRFDLIVANPPYLLDAGERAYRHGGGSLGEGLSLAIAGLASTRLEPGGTLLLYTGSAIVEGHDQLRASLAGRLDAEPSLHWRYEELDPDVFGEELEEPPYAHVDRIAVVLLTVMRRDV